MAFKNNIRIRERSFSQRFGSALEGAVFESGRSLSQNDQRKVSSINSSILALCQQWNFFSSLYKEKLKEHKSKKERWIHIKNIKTHNSSDSIISLESLQWLSESGFEVEYKMIEDHSVFYDYYIDILYIYSALRDKKLEKALNLDRYRLRLKMNAVSEFIEKDTQYKANNLIEKIYIGNDMGKLSTKKISNSLYILGKSIYPSATFLKFF